MSKQRHNWLKEITSLPTAAGCEQRVVAWVEDWVSRRTAIKLRRGRFGNLMLSLKGKRSGKPIVFEAHMDHPAFVVTKVDGRDVHAEFRGGVQDDYFMDTRVQVHTAGGPQRGKIVDFKPATKQRMFREVIARLGKEVDARPGDVMTWALPEAKIGGDRLHAPACDDLAGVAAALAAFDALSKKKRGGKRFNGDVRVLLTRAEEIGFIGAMAACRSGILPKDARVVALENSKSFADSPIGGGPIVRVGDKTSVFDRDLTFAIERVAERLGRRGKGMAWQRRLMPGGTCEATAFQTCGYTATCLCLPLGNYHNMDEQAGRIAPETIALSDFDGLVKLLVEVGLTLDDTSKTPTLSDRLDRLFNERAYVLG